MWTKKESLEKSLHHTEGLEGSTGSLQEARWGWPVRKGASYQAILPPCQLGGYSSWGMAAREAPLSLHSTVSTVGRRWAQRCRVCG